MCPVQLGTEPDISCVREKQQLQEGRYKVNGFLLLIPFFIVRFGLLAALNPEAVRRAAYFAPMRDKERIAYCIYQISNAGIFIYLIFLKVRMEDAWWFYCGAACYLLGLCLCEITIANFASPNDAGLNRNGIYKFSRNPMYIAYFIHFIGMALLTQSWILASMVLVFQISAHWIILAEERWCLKKFGAAYEDYMRSVRRYL